MDSYIDRQMVDRAPSQQSKVRFIPVMCKYIKNNITWKLKMNCTTNLLKKIHCINILIVFIYKKNRDWD